MMAYRGKYTPTNPKKYKGNPSNIIYRSLWERKFMVYCDRNEKIIECGSEEFFIPYRSPLDNRIHRYFPDFYVKVKTPTGTKKWVIEVKPKAQCKKPRIPKRKTKRYVTEVQTWVTNEAKWKNAIEFCKDKGMEFKILTEVELGI